jgi:lipoate-protein ligase A
MYRFRARNLFNQPLKSLNRFYCSKKTEYLLTERIIPSKKSGNLTIVSLSNDIYYNLALEQYIADNYDFENRNILFLWQNEPCVVIGRYQNAWTECNLVEMKRINDMKLARRASGGGCVYHGQCCLILTL